jgi:ELWxxDGT repeat protein
MKNSLSNHNTTVAIAMSKIVVVFFIFFMFHVLSATAQPALLKDVNTELEPGYMPIGSLKKTSTHLFYISAASLWVTQGSKASTIQLKAFSSIDNLTVVGTGIYFSADDGSGNGAELRKSNGTVSGTVRIRDIFPGTASSSPAYFAVVNSSTVYFSANDGMHGRELWKTNGTAAGTVLVKDIVKVTGGSNPAFITKVNGLVFFAANDGQLGIELWKSDGTAEGTVIVKDIKPGLRISSKPQLLTESNGKLFFRADDGVSNFELYQSDGTLAGTYMLKDIRPGATAGDVENLINVNGKLFFTANDGVHGDELWKSDGTASGTMLVKDLNPGSGGSNNTTGSWGLGPMGNFANVNGVLFFTAGKGVAENFAVRSDGTAAGTYRVTDLLRVGLNNLQPCFTYLNGLVYFFDQYDRDDYRLFHMDLSGNNITDVRKYIVPEDYYASFEQVMISFGGALYLSALKSYGWDLVKQYTDGNIEIMSSVYGPTVSSNPDRLTQAGGYIYFQATIGYASSYYELWRTDGTAAGTIRVSDLSVNYELVPIGNKMFFNNENKLYVTQGTPETTTKLIELNAGYIHRLTNVNGILYFQNYSGELWKSDGTVAGTIKVRTLQFIHSITNVNGKAFVLNETSTGGLELWRTNLTGMLRVKVINPNLSVWPNYGGTAAIGSVFFFVANDGIHGNEVWRSDGTDFGTMMIADLNTIDSVDNTGSEGDIRGFTVFNNRLYFSGTNSANNWQLFMVTGKNSIAPVSALDPVIRTIVYNNQIYLFTTREEDGYVIKVWRSDGTAAGGISLLTVTTAYGFIDEAVVGGNLYYSTSANNSLMQVTECGVVPVDVGSWSTYPLEGLNNDLIFGGFNPAVGIEPFIYRNFGAISSPCATAATIAAQPDDNALITSWPNPFTTDFSLRVNGAEGQKANVVIFNDLGFPVERLNDLETNNDYQNLGSKWPKGIYLLRIEIAGKVTTQRLVRN